MTLLDGFYFHPGVYDYNFGPTHPLRPERMRRFFALLERFSGDVAIISEPAGDEDLLRVHSAQYIEAVEAIEAALALGEDDRDEILKLRGRHGFFGDNPPFPGIARASRAYAGASIAAARAVRDGKDLAFGIGGGLHHAMPDKASGFCIFNDCAIACSVLRERFERVAYVDVDVHHGDGVQWIFYEDPTVLTCSIHEDGRTLWPGTGGLEEVGADFTSLNVPMQAGTTADVWIDTFLKTIIPALEIWKPGAIVLQMGTDSHYLDPLAHINSNQQAWLAAVVAVKNLGLPIVALGGGGYNLTTVPRMWVSACLTLAGVDYPDEIPTALRPRLEAETFSDREYPFRPEGGRVVADRVIRHLTTEHLPNL